jgi:folate-binding protein YgfZ
MLASTMTQTALYQRLASSGAHLGLYSGSETALSFAGPAQELRTLYASAGVFDLGWRGKIIVTGQDRVRWLNGVLTNNVRDLPPNRGNYNFLLNAQGRILADIYVYNRGEYLLLDTDRSQIETVIKTLDHFIIMDDVELQDASETLTAIGLCGPKAEEVLSASGIDLSGLQPIEVRDLLIKDLGVSVVRGPEQKPGWYEIWMSTPNAEAIWDTLIKDTLIQVGGQPVGTEALELWRILQGIPRYGKDIRERDLPQETEQEHALNYTKGCYIGQEIVERIRSRGQVHRKFTGFEFQNGLPELGKIEENGRVVAEITSIARVPSGTGEKDIALGYIRREGGAPGSQIQLNGKTARITNPPFEISLT